jgi:hypothetical protein
MISWRSIVDTGWLDIPLWKMLIRYQEETQLCTITQKEMLKWDERAHRTLNQIDYIREIQKDRGEEEHGMIILIDDSMAIIHMVIEFNSLSSGLPIILKTSTM